MATVASSSLPSQQAATFKRILKCYEQKQYKQALKHCKAILTTPGLANHGETLSMKGLILNALDKKTEAYEFARLGLKNDLKSHVCWHVYGLIYRSDKNYPEALKCFRNALRFDKDNLQILRDLSLLQIQVRDLEGYAVTRNTILGARPQQRASWFGYAIACQLQGHLDEAIHVISTYESAHADSNSSGEGNEEYEAGELIMYKAQLYVEKGDYAGSLAYLASKEDKLLDKLGLNELKAQIYLKLGKAKEAECTYSELFRLSPENKNFLVGLEESLGFTDATPQETRVAFCKELLKTNPSSTLKRHPLFFTSGALFETLVDDYLRVNIRKGVTPLFRLIRSLYSNPEKVCRPRSASLTPQVAVVDKLLKGYLSSLLSVSKFSNTDSAPVETPASLLWTYFTLAQHVDWCGQSQEALKLIDDAIAHTPTMIDLYMVKAKILKHGGNPVEAAKVMDTARELDTADRYLNSKAVKYCLRANDILRAEELAAMFTRSEKSTDPIGQLSEMQCIWFETEEALAFLRTGAVGKALKKLKSIDSHFVQFTDDQFDFHSYCFRKSTLRAYIRLLRLEDQIYGQRSFVRAALIAIDTYVGLHDVPFTAGSTDKADASMDGLSEAEKKKLLSKQRKAAKRAETQAPPAKEEAKSEGKGEDKKPVDTDPDGLQLAQTATPLDEALKFLRPLLTLAGKNIDVQCAAFEIYWRKQKPLLMLQALNRAAAIDPNHPRLHSQRVRFLHKYSAALGSLNPKVAEVIRGELPNQFGDATSASAFNAKFLEKNKGSYAHVLSGAEMMVLLDPTSAPAATKLITTPSGDLQTCSRALETLVKTLKASDETVARFRESCRKLFPLASAFAEDK